MGWSFHLFIVLYKVYDPISHQLMDKVNSDDSDDPKFLLKCFHNDRVYFYSNWKLSSDWQIIIKSRRVTMHRCRWSPGNSPNAPLSMIFVRQSQGTVVDVSPLMSPNAPLSMIPLKESECTVVDDLCKRNPRHRCRWFPLKNFMAPLSMIPPQSKISTKKKHTQSNNNATLETVFRRPLLQPYVLDRTNIDEFLIIPEKRLRCRWSLRNMSIYLSLNEFVLWHW